MLSASDFLFVLMYTLLSKKNVYIIIELLEKIKFLIAFRVKNIVCFSTIACAAYTNVITSCSLLPTTGVSIKDGISLT